METRVQDFMTLTFFARKHILPDLKQIRGYLVVSLVLLFVTTFSQIASIEAARALIQTLQIRLAGAEASGFVAWLGARFHLGDDRLFVTCAIVALALPVATYVLMYARDIFFELVSIKLTKMFQDRVYARVVTLPYPAFKEFRVAALVKRIHHDSAQIRRLVLDVGLFRLSDIVIFIGVIVYLGALEPRLTLVSLSVLVLYVVLAWFSARVAAQRIRAVDRSREEVSGFAQESFERFLDIRANAREAFETGRFAGITENAAQRKRWHAYVLLFDRCMTNLLSAIGPVAVMVIGGSLVMKGITPLETLMAFVAATSMLYGPVDQLSAIPMALKELEVSVNNLEEIFRHPSEAERAATQDDLPTPSSAPAAFLAIRDMEFEFPGARRRFRFSRLEIFEGERVALVGPSGAGKTTLLLLLFRIFSEYRGGIYLKGKELRSIPLGELRGRMGLMLQDNYIFADTVARNVAYGAPVGQAVGEEETLKALAKARLDQEILRMPLGLQTLLEHMGSNISGGQRRRLILSRAIIKRPELLLLDEPLTGVPPMEVQAIIDALTKEKLGTTLIISTHQAEILRAMDRVIVLGVSTGSGGDVDTVIEAVGAHEQLMGSCAFYREQFGKPGH